uniref:Gag-pol polyprotein, related n=1 Tax=Medicago truncatula TaxID=3880 RepID=A2Q2L9_MEDTR|nr:gag-pol polyprotein, related [Medicago truncatula]
MKFISIEEAEDISSLKVDELIGSLQNFEITVNIKTDKKGKGIAFACSVNSKETPGNFEDDVEMTESLALLGRKLKKFFKQYDRIKEKMARADEKNPQYKGVQCHECEGYGHIRTEYDTFLKRQNKILAVSWSDGDNFEDEGKTEYANHFSALTGRIMSDTESYEEEMSYDELAMAYYELIARNGELTQMVEKQEDMITQLQEERNENLAQILELNEEVFDHCKGKGHIRPYCFKLHESKNPHPNSSKKKWIPRSVISGLIAHTSLRATSKEDWYFDSGCSRHMSGVDKYLENVRPYTSSYVTFVDGAKGKIVGIGNLIKHGLPRLDNVFIVKGLTANLISISQLCDQGL